MSTRQERRKTLKEKGYKHKSLPALRKEILALPKEIQALFKASMTGFPIPDSVWEEAKITWPQYFDLNGKFQPLKWQ